VYGTKGVYEVGGDCARAFSSVLDNVFGGARPVGLVRTTSHFEQVEVFELIEGETRTGQRVDDRIVAYDGGLLSVVSGHSVIVVD
jgi:hypothetical protein